MVSPNKNLPTKKIKTKDTQNKGYAVDKGTFLKTIRYENVERT